MHLLFAGDAAHLAIASSPYNLLEKRRTIAIAPYPEAEIATPIHDGLRFGWEVTEGEIAGAGSVLVFMPPIED